jgi:hypothetical protein
MSKATAAPFTRPHLPPGALLAAVLSCPDGVIGLA